MDKVLVVLNNYSRPQNMLAVIRAWKEQSVPVYIVVVDNRPIQEEESYPDEGLGRADDVWRMTENLGCPCHFYPPLALYWFRYTVLADDDLLPGKEAIEGLLERATKLNDEFSTIGQIGRMIDYNGPTGFRYDPRRVPFLVRGGITQADLTCRVKMVRTDSMPYVFSFRQNILARARDGADRLCGIHDDMLLDFGVQLGTGFPSYTIPREIPGRRLIEKDLDDGVALWRKAGHFEDRNRMVDLCIEAGWRPIV